MCKDFALETRLGYFSVFVNNLRCCRFIHGLLICLILFGLVACGAATEELELAPERPFGTITGRVYDGSLTDATVAAYTFASLEEREYLGKADVGEDGQFELQIQAPSQVIFLELSADSYVEPASNVTVAVTDRTKLTALLDYSSGQSHSATITPFTHMVTALASYYSDIGKSAANAYTDANAEFESLYGIRFDTTLPVNESLINDDQSDTEEEVLYGLLLAGFSELTRSISKVNEPNLNETINSWYLSQLLYNDISIDGVLNGIWSEESAQEKSSLIIGNTAVDAAVLQQQLAGACLNSFIYEPVKQKLDLNIIENFILQFSSKASVVLNSENTEPLNTPVVTLPQVLAEYYAGSISLSASVSGILKLKSVKFFIDNDLIESSASDLLKSREFNTADYADGKHVLTIVALDEFGNEGSALFDIVFDNTSPTIDVLSALITNRNSYRLSGTYTEGGSGIEEISVDQSAAVMGEDNTWFMDLELVEGNNSILVNVVDKLGNQQSKEVNVILDTKAPVIDSQDKNSEVTYVIENENYLIDRLKDVNSLPVYLATDKLSLQGEAVSGALLKEKVIPYFSFTVIDPVSEGYATTFEKLSTKIRIEKNAEVIRDWFSVNAEQTQFYLPLIQEVIGPEINHAQISDKFIIRARVVDEAGNFSEKLFEFFVALFIPDQDVSLKDTALGDSWQSVDFLHRSRLYDRDLPALEFEYINTSPQDVYIKPAEVDVNKVIQTYEVVTRENKVRLKTRPFWRIGKVDNPRRTCPEFNGVWQPVNQLFNYAAKGIWKEERPQVTVSDLISVSQDVMAPIPDSSWADMADFDNVFELIEVKTDSGDVLSYYHDYVIDTGISGMAQPALVTDWRSYTAADKKTVICNDMRHIQFMEKYEYLQEPGYPRNIITEQNVEETFETSKFKVLGEDGRELIASDGWYQVPVSHKVVIQKFVTTPLLTSQNDEAVASPDSIKDYTPQKLDLDITWVLSQSLNIEFANDISNKLNETVLSRQLEYRNATSYFSLSRN